MAKPAKKTSKRPKPLSKAPRKPPRQPPFVIRFPVELRERLDAAALDQKATLAEVVRGACEAYLKQIDAEAREARRSMLEALT